MVAHFFNPWRGSPALEGQREINFCETKVGLVYIVNSRLARATGRTCHKKTKNKPKKTSNSNLTLTQYIHTYIHT